MKDLETREFFLQEIKGLHFILFKFALSVIIKSLYSRYIIIASVILAVLLLIGLIVLITETNRPKSNLYTFL